jgi:hypothetical protein
LRATQHFDALQIENVEDRPEVLADVDAIDVQADGRIPVQGRVLLRGTADRDHHAGVVVD